MLSQEYLKKLIINIEKINSARVEFEKVLGSMGLNDLTNEFLLHYEVLYDYGFIEGVGDSGCIGIDETDSGTVWFNAHIRLTAKGHEFTAAIRKSEVWELIKNNFKDSSIETIFSVAKDIVKSQTKNKLESLLE